MMGAVVSWTVRVQVKLDGLLTPAVPKMPAWSLAAMAKTWLPRSEVSTSYQVSVLSPASGWCAGRVVEDLRKVTAAVVGAV